MKPSDVRKLSNLRLDPEILSVISRMFLNFTTKPREAIGVERIDLSLPVVVVDGKRADTGAFSDGAYCTLGSSFLVFTVEDFSNVFGRSFKPSEVDVLVSFLSSLENNRGWTGFDKGGRVYTFTDRHLSSVATFQSLAHQNINNRDHFTIEDVKALGKIFQGFDDVIYTNKILSGIPKIKRLGWDIEMVTLSIVKVAGLYIDYDTVFPSIDNPVVSLSPALADQQRHVSFNEAISVLECDDLPVPLRLQLLRGCKKQPEWSVDHSSGKVYFLKSSDGMVHAEIHDDTKSFRWININDLAGTANSPLIS